MALPICLSNTHYRPRIAHFVYPDVEGMSLAKQTLGKREGQSRSHGNGRCKTSIRPSGQSKSSRSTGSDIDRANGPGCCTVVFSLITACYLCYTIGDGGSGDIAIAKHCFIDDMIS